MWWSEPFEDKLRSTLKKKKEKKRSVVECCSVSSCE